MDCSWKPYIPVQFCGAREPVSVNCFPLNTVAFFLCILLRALPFKSMRSTQLLKMLWFGEGCCYFFTMLLLMLCYTTERSMNVAFVQLQFFVTVFQFTNFVDCMLACREFSKHSRNAMCVSDRIDSYEFALKSRIMKCNTGIFRNITRPILWRTVVQGNMHTFHACLLSCIPKSFMGKPDLYDNHLLIIFTHVGCDTKVTVSFTSSFTLSKWLTWIIECLTCSCR